jgi:cardiolipin synthase
VKYLPNIISILRILLVIPTVNYLWHNEYGKALTVFFIAGVSDVLDGFLARRFGWVTRFGSLLDPLGDKLLMTAIYFTLGLMGQLPVWLVALVIGRDLVIISGALAYRLLVKEITMQHLFISKLNTGAQILLVLLLIFQLSTFPFASLVSAQMITALIYLVTFTTLASGIAYVLIWSLRARNALKVRMQ